MKKFIVLSSFLLCLSAWSQETHSPQFKCINVENGEIKYVLIGNEFPQIPDFDWSDEVILATKDEYLNGIKKSDFTYTFKVKPSDIGFLTNENSIKLADDSEAKSSLMLNEAFELTHTLTIANQSCSENEINTCFEVTKYNCLEQNWVD